MTGSFNQIDKVAVIGAGISGVVTAAHLLNAGLEVTVFERNKEAGGVWYAKLEISFLEVDLVADKIFIRLYDDRRPIESIYPATRPSKGEQTGDYEEIQESDRLVLEHAPPGYGNPFGLPIHAENKSLIAKSNIDHVTLAYRTTSQHRLCELL